MLNVKVKLLSTMKPTFLYFVIGIASTLGATFEEYAKWATRATENVERPEMVHKKPLNNNLPDLGIPRLCDMQLPPQQQMSFYWNDLLITIHHNFEVLDDCFRFIRCHIQLFCMGDRLLVVASKGLILSYLAQEIATLGFQPVLDSFSDTELEGFVFRHVPNGNPILEHGHSINLKVYQRLTDNMLVQVGTESDMFTPYFRMSFDRRA